MGEPTDGRKTDPTSPLDLMISFVEGLNPAADWSAVRELALILDAEGVLDGLDDNDARHVIASTLADMVLSEGTELCARADWIDSGEGAGPLHDPAGSATALRRIAELSEL